jgi:uncharacterized lipoprotein YehR (DUF1307 family)
MVLCKVVLVAVVVVVVNGCGRWKREEVYVGRLRGSEAVVKDDALHVNSRSSCDRLCN